MRGSLGRRNRTRPMRIPKFSMRRAIVAAVVTVVLGGMLAMMLWPSNEKTEPLSLVLSEARERSEEHTSELQSLMRISYAVFCLKKKKSTMTLQYHKM